jgi:glycosyltransferase involved in cell wall biosynthesis
VVFGQVASTLTRDAIFPRFFASRGLPGPDLKVLQVHNRYRSSSPSGENRVVDNEALALRSEGHIVEQFERHTEEIDHWPAVKKALLPARVVWSRDSYTTLVRALRQNRPDVVHVHNTFPLLSSSVLHACSRERVPVVTTLHNYRLICPAGALFRDGAPCHECVGRLPLPAVRHGCYRGSTLATVPMAISTVVHRHTWGGLVSAYVCVSESERERLAPLGLPRDRVFVKPNLIFASALGPVADKREVVVYLGRLTAIKGVGTLMNAWDIFRASSPDGGLRMAIAGSGPMEDEVVAWAARRPEVDFLGMLTPAECDLLLSGARAAVVPSESEETFGLVAIEAMRAGVPVIAAAHGALPELVGDGEEGTLYPPGDVAALAKVFHEVETVPERYAGYGDNARKAYQTRFDPDANIKRLVSIYEFAVENPVWASGPR